MGTMAEVPTEPGFTASDALILGLYAFGIGVNAYLVVDAMTDGELTRRMSVILRNTVGRLRYRQKEETELRKAQAHVIFEAISVVEGAKDNDND